MKFAPDKDFCSTRKDSKSDYGKVTPKGVKWGVKRGQNGVMGVKSYLSSDLHQIWCEGAFLQFIKGSLLRFTMFWLLVPIWPLEGVKMGVKWGQNRVKYYLGSDLHQIWWEGAFLQVIKGSSIRFSSFWLLGVTFPKSDFGSFHVEPRATSGANFVKIAWWEGGI